MIFIDNKYTTWYFNIVNKAYQNNNTECYTEKHHIIPKSLGGDNSKENLVTLRAREHFVCHWLLTKMTSGSNKAKMITALRFMLLGKNNSQNRHFNGRVYENIKQQYSEQMTGHRHFGPFKQSDESNKKRSEKLKGTRLKEKNPFYGKNHTEESRKKMREAAKHKIRTKEHNKKIAEANKINGIKKRGKIPKKILCCGKLYDPGNLAKHVKSNKHMMN